ncbi:ATP-binding protein [Spirillospora sp. NPDC029432]|uniref:ATP-binding protein n=1 Tax=Spirillospora sp. NPDC029432 TaxID=3154599 RepID=UPI0034527483
MTAAMERLGDQLLLTGDRMEGRAARRAVRERAAKVVGDGDVLDDIELMTSEAIANALLHGSGPISVTVVTDGRRVRVEVRDGGPAARCDPARRGIDHGRGLNVIDSLAAEWALERSCGETRLWFVVDRPGAAPPGHGPP